MLDIIRYLHDLEKRESEMTAKTEDFMKMTALKK